jgi:hypothetical protein
MCGWRSAGAAASTRSAGSRLSRPSLVKRGFLPDIDYLQVRAAMRTDRTRSGAARASSRLALVIAREIEPFAARRGRMMGLDAEDIEAVAEHAAQLVASTPPKLELVDAQDLAEQLGVARDWVYANAERLGVVRLGTGPRAPPLRR